MITETSVLICRPIADVFAFTHAHVPRWSSIVVSDEILDDQSDGGVGTKFKVVTEEQGRRMEFAGEVTHHDPPNQSAMILRGSSFDIQIAYTSEQDGDSVRVTQFGDVTSNNLAMKIVFWLVGKLSPNLPRTAADRDLSNLKRLLESGE